MFSANENLILRQHKKRVVEYVESCIPERALDMGTVVMAMQVSCKAPGCVPLETAIVIVFPKLSDEQEEELIPGLAESKGGHYKTKVLKPMAECTKEDVLEALPPEFPGGTRSMEKLCLQARDVMLGQITQLFADDDKQGRRLMAEYLQQCLKEYVDRDCTPPEWGELCPPLQQQNDEQHGGDGEKRESGSQQTNTEIATTNSVESKQAGSESPGNININQEEKTAAAASGVTKTGNFVFKRPIEDEKSSSTRKNDPSSSSSAGTTNNTLSRTSLPIIQASCLNQANTHSAATTFAMTTFTTTAKRSTTNNNVVATKKSSHSIIAQLLERQHAPGIRRPGCPCCDPDNADNLIDQMMAL